MSTEIIGHDKDVVDNWTEVADSTTHTAITLQNQSLSEPLWVAIASSAPSNVGKIHAYRINAGEERVLTGFDGKVFIKFEKDNRYIKAVGVRT